MVKRKGWAMILAMVATGIVGCGEEQGGEEAQHATESPAALHADITWHKDIQPLLERSCIRCHNGDGVGPGDLRSYEDAAPVAELLAAYVGQGLMPPAVSDPDCRPYRGWERMTLTEDERDVFVKWAELGAPEGDPATAPELQGNDEDTLKGANLDVLIPQKHSPKFNATGNEYVCYAIPNPRTEDGYVTAYDAIVDQVPIMHHMIAYIDEDGDAGRVYGDKPFDCFFEEADAQLNLVRKDWRMIGAWVPGQVPFDYGENMGMELPAGGSIILEMHYFKPYEGAELLKDQSGMSFRVKDKVDKRIIWWGIGPDDFVIPAGNDNYTVKASVDHPSFLYPGPIEVIETNAHMHLLGKHGALWMEQGDGSDVCLHDGPYDFNNQLTYFLEEPYIWQPDEKLWGSCTWNNSTSNPNLYYNPPIDIEYGDGTDAEMCFMSVTLAIPVDN